MMTEERNIQIIIIRYLQGVCTDIERQQLFAWLQADATHEIEFFELKEIFDSKHRMIMHDSSAYRGYKQMKRRSLQMPQWLRYAAVLLILLGVGILANFIFKEKPQQNEAIRQIVVHNTRGVYQVSLPDSTHVWLHGGTTLTYPERFIGHLRNVDLQGEAYFSVRASEENPFVVKTSEAIIQATGTEFNITAYPKDHLTTTTLVKGVVSVFPANATGEKVLHPDQQALVRGNQMLVADIHADLFIDWKDGIYRFRNEPFQNIALRLEKMFGMQIQVEDEKLKKAAFSGMFTESHSLKETLEIIDISTPIVYQVKNQTVYIKSKK